ncbi:MAG TPA: MFS transporter [Methanocorpusculum sp.]|nr:MFS transporter [Methanocorpusculum sp.]
MVLEKTKRIAGLAAGHGAVDFYMPVIPAILPALIPLFYEQGITSYAMAGCLFTFATIATVIFQPLSGYLVDNNKRILGTSTTILITAFGIGAFALTQNYWILLIFSVIMGIGNAMYHPNAYKQVHQITTSANRASFLSLISVGGTFGYGAAPLAAGFLYAWGGFHALLLLLIPGIIIALLLLKLPQRPEMTESESSFEQADAAAKPNWKSASIVLLISSLRTCVYFGFIAFAAEYLTNYAGVEYVLSTAVVSSMIFAGIFGTLIAGPLSDKIGRKEVMFFAYLFGTAAYSGIFIFSGAASVICLAATGFFFMATASVEIAAVQELMPGNVGFASGIVIGIPQGLSAVSVLFIGIIADVFGMPAALFNLIWLMIAAIVLCAALPYPLKILRRRRKNSA